MEIQQLNHQDIFEQGPMIYKSYKDLESLLDELRSRSLNEEVVTDINKKIDEMNSFRGNEKEYTKQLKKTQQSILYILHQKIQIVPQNYYRNMWMGLGMAVFGIPMGTALGLIMENMAFIGAGIAIGVPLGLAIGTSLDKKAEKEGRQLSFELNK
jgi:hypothetical protein